MGKHTSRSDDDIGRQLRPQFTCPGICARFVVLDFGPAIVAGQLRSCARKWSAPGPRAWLMDVRAPWRGVKA